MRKAPRSNRILFGPGFFWTLNAATYMGFTALEPHYRHGVIHFMYRYAWPSVCFISLLGGTVSLLRWSQFGVLQKVGAVCLVTLGILLLVCTPALN